MNRDLVIREIQASETKTHLLQILDEVERGETVIITRHGRPIALLTRPPATAPGPKLGTLRGKIRYNPGWDDPMTDEEFEEFSGGEL